VFLPKKPPITASLKADESLKMELFHWPEVCAKSSADLDSEKEQKLVLLYINNDGLGHAVYN
jgi:hypothetical protein